MTGLSLAAFLAGAGVGLAVAAPIGPMGLLCIQRTLAFGMAAGLATGLAAATVQVTYGLVAVLGLNPTATALTAVDLRGLSVVSAGLLFWFAYRVATREVAVRGTLPTGRLQLARSYRDALAFGFANPLTVVLFFAAFPALTSTEDVLDAPLLVVGVFTGVAGWYLALSTAAVVLREQLSQGMLRHANRAAGLVLAAMGGLTLANAFA
jgi:threonine/homoserine/homoserine lactone efflux protein